MAPGISDAGGFLHIRRPKMARRGRPKKAIPTPPEEIEEKQQQQQPKQQAEEIELNDLELACFEAASQMQEQITKRMKVYFQREMEMVDNWMRKAHESLKARGIDMDSLKPTDYQFNGSKIVKRG